ncbi:MAG: septum formation initiator family protein [Clostridia bacterium]|nr:septum formation initiator family protein [Clostridia bacterium]
MQNNRVKRRVTGRFFAFLLSLVVLYAGALLFKQFRLIRDLKEEQEKLIGQMQETEMERDKLKYLIQTAQTDAYIESVARDKLGWVKPGETRYVIRGGE